MWSIYVPLDIIQIPHYIFKEGICVFKKIGQRIRKVRLEHGIKQKDLAKKINISQGALTNFELGRRKISRDWLLKISRALDVPLGCFVSAIDPPPEGDMLDPKDHRLIRAFRRLSRTPGLQMELLHVIERMSYHLESAAGRAGRSRPPSGADSGKSITALQLYRSLKKCQIYRSIRTSGRHRLTLSSVVSSG